MQRSKSHAHFGDSASVVSVGRSTVIGAESAQRKRRIMACAKKRPTAPCRRGQRQLAWNPRTKRARASQQTTDEDEKTALRFHLELVEKDRKLSAGTIKELSLVTLTQCLQDVTVANEVRAPKPLQTFLADAHLKAPTGLGVPPRSQAFGDVTEFLRQWPFPNTAHVDVDVLHPTTVDMTTFEKMQLLAKGLISNLLLPLTAKDAQGAEQVQATGVWSISRSSSRGNIWRRRGPRLRSQGVGGGRCCCDLRCAWQPTT